MDVRAARLDPRGNGRAVEEPGADLAGRRRPCMARRHDRVQPAAPIPVAEQRSSRPVSDTSTNGGGPVVPASLPEQSETSDGRPDRSPPGADAAPAPLPAGQIAGPPLAATASPR